jgi:ribonuclease HI
MACDGALCENGAGALAILVAPSSVKIKYAIRLDFEGCTNNMVEYEGC